MSQQTKRRRKRYEPGSAYAGHVRPKGVFGVFSNVRLFMIIGVVIMVGSLGIGGIIGSGVLGGGGGGPGPRGQEEFVKPGDKQKDGTAQPEATVEVKQYQSAPTMTIDTNKRYLATIKTEAGDIQVELLAQQVPQTVNNFVFLARDGFYNGLAFYFVEPTSHAQAGDPRCTSAQASPQTCGGGAGYDLPQEAPGSFDAGLLGMVNSSQFFIALQKSDAFDQFTPFGRVTSGLEVARQLTRGAKIEAVEVQEQ